MYLRVSWYSKIHHCQHQARQRCTKNSYQIHIPYTSLIILLPPTRWSSGSLFFQELKQHLCTNEMFTQYRQKKHCMIALQWSVCLTPHIPLYLCRQPYSQRRRNCQSRWVPCRPIHVFTWLKLGTSLTGLFQKKKNSVACRTRKSSSVE
jgi:hypothetical protein